MGKWAKKPEPITDLMVQLLLRMVLHVLHRVAAAAHRREGRGVLQGRDFIIREKIQQPSDRGEVEC